MNAITKTIQKVQVHHLKIAFAVIVFLKMVFLLLVLDGTVQIFPTETDADTYDRFALGQIPNAYSIWSYILKDLHAHALYNRTVLTIVIYGVTSFITPFIFAALLPHVNNPEILIKYYKIYWIIAIYISLYPSLNLFALDVFRDAVMVFIVSLTFYTMKNFDSNTRSLKYVLLITLGSLYYLVYLFRPYLGGALFLAFVLRHIQIYRLNKILLIGLFIVGILAFRSMGWLDSLIVYRGGIDMEAGGGSALNLSLQVENSFDFLSLYLLSFIYQFFGLHINSISLLILFFSESIFIIIAVIYVFVHRSFVTKNEEYLLWFVIVYTATYTFFNDNMGTAIRLRLFDYLAIITVAASLYIRQLNASTKVKV